MLSMIYTEKESKSDECLRVALKKLKNLFNESRNENRFARWCEWEVSDTTNTSKKLFSGKRASDRTWNLINLTNKQKNKRARECWANAWKKEQKLKHWIRYKLIVSLANTRTHLSLNVNINGRKQKKTRKIRKLRKIIPSDKQTTKRRHIKRAVFPRLRFPRARQIVRVRLKEKNRKWTKNILINNGKHALLTNYYKKKVNN